MNGPYDVSSLAELEALYPSAVPGSLAKESRVLTPAYRLWLEEARFFAMATSGPGEEGLDCSPRGDAMGQAFKVLDGKTLAIPDRRGNNRLDSLRNIVLDGRVGLLFLIPGILEALRINGRARLTTDPDLRQCFAWDNTLPVTVILIQIEAVYFQCARALMRSELWEERARRRPEDVPSAGAMARSAAPNFDAESYDRTLRDRQKKTLY